MHILLRDVRELEELTAEIRESGTFDQLDMELLHTRISGVRHLLEIAGEPAQKSTSQAGRITSKEPPEGRMTAEPVASPAREMASLFPAEENKEALLPSAAEKEETPVIADGGGHTGTAATKEEPLPLSTPGNPSFGNTPPETPPAETVPTVSGSPEPSKPNVTRGVPGSKTSEDLLFSGGADHREEELTHGDKQILGERFTAGQSVHDRLMTGKNRVETKFSNIPITHLASSIGTNDRFLFSRELFDGNMELFYETIRKIDHMQTTREAFDFLKEFNWKRNETSLKFVELVKRRFLQNG